LFQELLYKIPIKKIIIPEWLGITKYLILIILVILLPVLTQETWFCKLCPVGAIEGSIPLLIIDESIRKMISWLFHIKILILYTIIYLSIITPRAFCRIFCPAGAIFSLFKYISIFGIHSSKDKCISCGKCKQRCPAGVTPVSIDCIICVECKDDCKHINIGCFLKTTAL
jgi:polyferredoxin